MNSDRNLMQFIFNFLFPPVRLDRRKAGARYLIYLGLFLVFGLNGETVSGQGFDSRDFRSAANN